MLTLSNIDNEGRWGQPPCTGGWVNTPLMDDFLTTQEYVNWRIDKTRRARQLIEELIYLPEEREHERQEIKLALMMEIGVKRVEKF